MIPDHLIGIRFFCKPMSIDRIDFDSGEIVRSDNVGDDYAYIFRFFLNKELVGGGRIPFPDGFLDAWTFYLPGDARDN